MVVSLKDSIKLIGISIVCFCAVFVCTFFLNFYLDAVLVGDTVAEVMRPLYDAQLATAKMVCAVTGGCLSAIAAVMIVFYVKLYIDGHARQIGVLKAMGYSDIRIAACFWVFGLSVFVGALLGYAAGLIAMPTIYKGLTLDGLDIPIKFHFGLIFALIFAPTAVFSAISCGYALVALRRPVLGMLRGTSEKVKKRSLKKPREAKERAEKERPFLFEACLKTISSKKMLAFFVAFSCFCFSAMLQMGLSMEQLSTQTMGLMILIIGVVLAAVTMIMAITSLMNGNVKNISIMKGFGYSMLECAIVVFAGYIPFALLGFVVGTFYQFGLLSLAVNVLYKNVAEMPDYSFNFNALWITAVAFVLSYAAVTAVYTLKMSKISVKEVMAEN